MRWFYSHCERILAPSDSTRDMLGSRGLERSRIDIWRRGVSTVRFDPAKRSAALREQWGVSDDRPAIIYVGRVSKEKGLQMLKPFSRFLEYAGRLASRHRRRRWPDAFGASGRVSGCRVHGDAAPG